MSQYVLDHHLEGEKKRLALMSQLLDPMQQQERARKQYRVSALRPAVAGIRRTG